MGKASDSDIDFQHCHASWTPEGFQRAVKKICESADVSFPEVAGINHKDLDDFDELIDAAENNDDLLSDLTEKDVIGLFFGYISLRHEAPLILCARASELIDSAAYGMKPVDDYDRRHMRELAKGLKRCSDSGKDGMKVISKSKVDKKKESAFTSGRAKR